MPDCRMQADIKDFLTGRGIEWEEADDLAEVAGDVDVLYQTRIQKERFQVTPMDTADCQSPALFAFRRAKFISKLTVYPATAAFS